MTTAQGRRRLVQGQDFHGWAVLKPDGEFSLVWGAFCDKDTIDAVRVKRIGRWVRVRFVEVRQRRTAKGKQKS